MRLRITELWYEAGLPPGVLNVVPQVATKRKSSSSIPRSGVSLCRFDQRRAAHLFDCRRQRQARAGADRGQEPCPGLSDCVLERTVAGHHQFLLRLRRRALHGAAGRGGGERHRRPLVEPVKASKDSTWARHMTRRLGWARWSTRATRNSCSTGSRPASRKAQSWFSTAASPSPARMRKGILCRPDDLRPRDRRDDGRARGDLRTGALHQARRQTSRRAGDDEQSRFANGSVIYTESGHYAREFA